MQKYLNKYKKYIYQEKIIINYLATLFACFFSGK